MESAVPSVSEIQSLQKEQGTKDYIHYLQHMTRTTSINLLTANEYELSRQTALMYGIDNHSVAILHELRRLDNEST